MERSKRMLFAIACFTLITSAVTLTGCGSKSNAPATPINAEQFEKLNENKDNNGKRFSITGYPYLDSDVTMSRGDNNVLISFWSESNGKGGYIGSFHLGYKDGKNGMYVPENFTPGDLQIFDNEGKPLGINDKIKVSFTMRLDTERAPEEATETSEFKDGKMITVKKGARYYGVPEDIEIEKAK